MLGGNSFLSMLGGNSILFMLGGNSILSMLGGNSILYMLGGNSFLSMLGGNSILFMLGGNTILLDPAPCTKPFRCIKHSVLGPEVGTGTSRTVLQDHVEQWQCATLQSRTAPPPNIVVLDSYPAQCFIHLHA